MMTTNNDYQDLGPITTLGANFFTPESINASSGEVLLYITEQGYAWGELTLQALLSLGSKTKSQLHQNKDN